jgi:hypothetical protein
MSLIPYFIKILDWVQELENVTDGQTDRQARHSEGRDIYLSDVQTWCVHSCYAYCPVFGEVNVPWIWWNPLTEWGLKTLRINHVL